MRTPDLIIGPRHDPQTVRWHFWKPFGFQFAIHKWLRSDSDRAPHDHKADNISIILSRQGYWELMYPYGGGTRGVWYYRKAWRIYFRKAETLHRVKLCDSRPVWSIWIRWPERRRWGYWCDGKGWVDADQYNKNSQTNGGYYAAGISEKGQGCD